MGTFLRRVLGHRLVPRAGPEALRALSPQGDALLALWKVERRQLKNFITVVIKCSLEIHGLFEAQELEEGLDVRVKIGEPSRRGAAVAGRGHSGPAPPSRLHLGNFSSLPEQSGNFRLILISASEALTGSESE